MKPVIDLVIRIKNGYMAGKPSIVAKATNSNVEVLKKLVAEGYIAAFDIAEEGVKKTANITLKYENGKPVFTDVKIVSKPGQRVYVASSDIPTVLNGLGICILSTNGGILTGREAKKAMKGGELLFNIW
ncbi:MAG: 30S ribosomal protein S8 [Patescibacteria group bacterium]